MAGLDADVQEFNKAIAGPGGPRATTVLEVQQQFDNAEKEPGWVSRHL